MTGLAIAATVYALIGAALAWGTTSAAARSNTPWSWWEALTLAAIWPIWLALAVLRRRDTD